MGSELYMVHPFTVISDAAVLSVVRGTHSSGNRNIMSSVQFGRTVIRATHSSRNRKFGQRIIREMENSWATNNSGNGKFMSNE